MFKRYLSVLCLAALSAASAEVLLSDNRHPEWPSDLFPDGTPRIATRATLIPDAEGDFACRGELMRTLMRGGNTTLLDGVSGPGGDFQVFSEFGGGTDQAGWTLDLNAPYLITRAALWTHQSDILGIASLEILLSDDGEHFVSAGTAAVDAESSRSGAQPYRCEVVLENPAIARHVRFQAVKLPGNKQMQLSEMAVWGEAVTAEMAAQDLSPASRRPAARFRVIPAGCGAAVVDWQEAAEALTGVAGWRLYRSEAPFESSALPGVELLEEFPAGVTRSVLFPLEPETTCYYGVTAVYAAGEHPAVAAVRHDTGKVLEAETFGDSIAINHFVGGGGARFTVRDNADAWEQVALDLLATTPVREIRWWRAVPEVVQEFYRRGIGVTTWISPDNVRLARELGIYKLESVNEPEYNGWTPASYLENQKNFYRLARESHPKNMVSAPASGLTTDGIEWLEEFYALGGKDYFDILDLHTYCKNTAEFILPPGYPQGSPEAMIERMEVVRDLMKRYGDEDKPLICTEFGYSDSNVANPSGSMTPERKAAFLTRGLLLHYVLGFKRLYLYSFWDEGDNDNFTEHSFGVVDYMMQKKPSFHALQTVGEVLGGAVYVEPMQGAASPFFGYVFRDRDSGRCITAVWNGAGEYSGRFRTQPGEVVVTAMTGERRSVAAGEDGEFKALLGPGPIYLEADAPVELLDARPYSASSALPQPVALELPRPVLTVPAGTAAEVEIRLHNPAAAPREVALSLNDAAGNLLARREITLPASGELQAGLPLPVFSDPLTELSLNYHYSDDFASYSDARTLFVRTLAGEQPPGWEEIFLSGYDAPVWRSGGAALEVTVDPARGGRILEILDRRTAANQITIDYTHLGDLENIAFAYCIWDQVSADPVRITPNAPYQARTEGEWLVLSHRTPEGLELEKRLRADDAGDLLLELTLTNHTGMTLTPTYHLHPEYVIGGTGDNNTDVIRVPAEGQLIGYPFWNGLGIRKTPPWDDGYWIVEDQLSGYSVRSDFSLDSFREPMIWFGIGCYNLEPKSVEGLTLAPGEAWRGAINWRFRPAGS